MSAISASEVIGRERELGVLDAVVVPGWEEVADYALTWAVANAVGDRRPIALSAAS